MAKKDSNEKGFTTAQERSRRRINVTVGVVVAAMAVIGIAGMALKGSDGSAQAAADSGTAQTQQAVASSQETAASAGLTEIEVVVAQSDEKTTTEETAVTPAGGSETAASDTSAAASSALSETTAASFDATAASQNSGLSLNADGTYTLPENMSVYASADESGQVVAQLYAGNQVVVGESAGNGWYSVTVWVGTNGSYAQMSGFMKLQ